MAYTNAKQPKMPHIVSGRSIQNGVNTINITLKKMEM